MPSLFANVGKAARDLLSKGFETAGHKITAKSSTASGVNFTSEIQHDASKGSVSSKLGAKYSDKKTGLEINKLEVDQDGKFSAKIYANDVVDNTRLVLDTVLEPMSASDENEKVEIGAEYVKDDVAVAVTVSPFDPTTVALNLNYAHEKFNFGASAQSENLVTKSEEESSEGSILDRFKSLGAVVGYTDKDVNANLYYTFGAANRKATAKTHNIEFNYLHQYDATTQLVSVLKFDDVVKSGAHNHSLQFGGKYKVDSESHVQAKFDASARTTDLSYSVKLRPSVTMVASTNFSLDINDSKFADAKLGLGFTFGQ